MCDSIWFQCLRTAAGWQAASRARCGSWIGSRVLETVAVPPGIGVTGNPTGTGALFQRFRGLSAGLARRTSGHPVGVETLASRDPVQDPGRRRQFCQRRSWGQSSEVRFLAVSSAFDRRFLRTLIEGRGGGRGGYRGTAVEQGRRRVGTDRAGCRTGACSPCQACRLGSRCSEGRVRGIPSATSESRHRQTGPVRDQGWFREPSRRATAPVAEWTWSLR